MKKSIGSGRAAIPLYILILTVSLKWLFEGVLGQLFLEAGMLACGLGLAVSRSGSKVKKISIIWVLYIVNIFFSVLFHEPSMGRIGRALVMIEIIFFLIFEKYDQLKYPQIYDFSIKLAFFYGFFEILQLIFKQNFNSIYFPTLTESFQKVANHYYRQGYFFGLIFNPHELTYLLALAFVALVLWQLISRKLELLRGLGCVALLALMFLTQKKGVIAISMVSLFLVICILYANRKHWTRIIGLIILVAVAGFILLRYIQTHTDSVLFRRIIQYFEKLSSGKNVDSGRGTLQRYAIEKFNEHRLFGIGWRKYNTLTTSVYGYDFGHEVNFDYLQWLCETGIIGFIMNIIPVLVTLGRTLLVCTKYVRNEKDLRIKWTVSLAIFSQFFTVMYAFIEIPFYDILVFAFYILSCIVINAAYLTYVKRRAVHGREILPAAQGII